MLDCKRGEKRKKTNKQKQKTVRNSDFPFCFHSHMYSRYQSPLLLFGHEVVC